MRHAAKQHPRRPPNAEDLMQTAEKTPRSKRNVCGETTMLGSASADVFNQGANRTVGATFDAGLASEPWRGECRSRMDTVVVTTDAAGRAESGHFSSSETVASPPPRPPPSPPPPGAPKPNLKVVNPSGADFICCAQLRHSLLSDMLRGPPWE
jgi:hypothetical protein